MGNMLKKFSTSGILLWSKVTRKRAPLFVSWIVTNQCNYACAYCNPARTKSRELSTSEACGLVEELALSGTKRISFTGGEPFLRNDLDHIIRSCKQNGIFTSISSNGSLVPLRIKDIPHIDILNLSLDGPQKIHDAVRGEGSFGDVMRAVEAAKGCGAKVAFNVTLSKFNLDCLKFFLKTAEAHRSLIYFQPGEINVLRGDGLNPYVHSPDKYRIFIEELMVAKKRNSFIGNSLSGLKHLSYWPSSHLLMKCYGGKLFCRIDANGDVKICGRSNGTRVSGNVLEGGFRKAFEHIKPVACDLCWCARRVEFNCALNGDPSALFNSIKIA
jgi:MoaA/NifB/PqqE/SkfB family radical SAM enzyme